MASAFCCIVIEPALQGSMSMRHWFLTLDNVHKKSQLRGAWEDSSSVIECPPSKVATAQQQK